MIESYTKRAILLIALHMFSAGVTPRAHGQSASLADFFPVRLDAGQTETLYLSDFSEIDWRIRKNTSLGPIDVILRNDAAPQTVRNYLNYVVSGAYHQGMVHRSVPGFVIQGGGYSLTGSGEDFQVAPIENQGTVPGEFQLPNVRGTLAMALVGGNPDSGTTQWFINVGNNPGLDDPANGPFTVFGEVLPPGMERVDEINSLMRVNFGDAFGEVPLIRFDQEVPVVFDDFLRLTTTEILDPPEILNVVPEGVIDVSLNGHRLVIESFPDALGHVEVTLGFHRNGTRVQEVLGVIVGTEVQSAFGNVQEGPDERYSSTVYGEIEFEGGDRESNRAFSYSLQAELIADEDSVQSPQYGQLVPNPWGLSYWVISEFFGLVHFGATGSQYAGWVSSERFGWMRFVEAGDGNRYLWVHRLQTWMAVNSDGSFHSFDFGWLVPEPGSLTRYNSRIGILIDDEHNPEGWLRSDRFGFVWFARDGTGVWFWSSSRNEWLGITSGGGIWSTAEGRFLP